MHVRLGLCEMWYRGLAGTNMPKSLQCMIQTLEFDRILPTRSLKGPKHALSTKKWPQEGCCQHHDTMVAWSSTIIGCTIICLWWLRILFQSSHDDWSIFHWLTAICECSTEAMRKHMLKGIYIKHWINKWEIVTSLLVWVPGSNFKYSFQLKAATSRIITLSVDFLHLQYSYHVIIVYLMPYLSIYLLMNVIHMHSRSLWWQWHAEEAKAAKCV